MVPPCAEPGCDKITDADLQAISVALKSDKSVTIKSMCDCALLLVGRWWRRSALCVCVCVSAHIGPVTLLSLSVCLMWVAVSRSLPVWSVSLWDQERG